MSLCLWKIWNCYIYTLSFRRQVVTRRKVLLDEMKWIIQRCEGLVKIINENNEGFSSFAVHCRCLAVEFDIQSKCRSQIHRKQWRMHFCSKIIWEFREKQQVRIIESEWWVLHLFKILSTWNCVSIVPVAKKLHRIHTELQTLLTENKSATMYIYFIYIDTHIYMWIAAAAVRCRKERKESEKRIQSVYKSEWSHTYFSHSCSGWKTKMRN